jgi:non-ribosomal peptide synthetase component F/thioesterase domain-containing protein
MSVVASNSHGPDLTQTASRGDVGGATYAFPVSPAQARIWRADRRMPGNSAYNACFRWNLDGLLNVKVLEDAFNEIIRRHEILRTTFREIGGKPRQVVASDLRIAAVLIDLSSLPDGEREAEMDRNCAEEAKRSFDLEKGPLVRVQLVKMGDRRHILTLSLHHIICDGWSIRVIMEELRQLYPAFDQGARSPLTDLTLQYPDYVLWQQEWGLDKPAEKQLAYWRSKLQGYSRLDVAPDFPRPTDPTIDSAILSTLLPQHLTDRLKEFSDRHGGTMFTTTLAACLLLLYQYTGRRDVSVGSPLARRSRPEIENLIGVFINDVVYRTDVEGDARLKDFMQKVKDTVWEALANQDIPYEYVVEDLSSNGQSLPEPLCTVNFICQRAFGGTSSLPFGSSDIVATPIPSKSQGALYDLNFFLVEREEGWRLSLEYNVNLYREATAKRLIDSFQQLLGEIPSSQDRLISELCPPDDPGQSTSAAGSAPNANEHGPVAESAVYTMPATVTQERFWSFARLDPASSAFNMPAAVRLSGHLSVESLEDSIGLVIRRHEILRTTFQEKRGELVQNVAEHLDFSMTVSIVAPGSAAEREDQLARLVSTESQRPFDLLHGPLIRAHLFVMDERDHVLVVTLHHIVSDGWSQSIFQRELWSVYEALQEGREACLEPLQIQYADFAVWQKGWIASREANEHRKFWMSRLNGNLPIVEFPTDRPPRHRPAKGDLETRALPEPLVRDIKSFCKREGVTPFMVTAACFAILLSKYGQQEDLLIGSPVANRRSETEALVGPFATPVALRFNLSREASVGEVLRHVRQVTVDAVSHADYPFELIARDLKVRSLRGRNPLFQFYFLYQTAFLQGRELSQLRVSPWSVGSIGTPFEMQLAIIERAGGVWANLDYNDELFDKDTIRDVLTYYEYVLRTFISDPSRRISDFNEPEGGRASDLSVADAERPAFVAPRNEYETLLAEIWRDVFGLPAIGIHDDFFALGGNSLRAAEFVVRLEKESGITIDLSTIIVRPTIEALANEIRLDTTGSLIIPLRAKGTRPPLFCIHPGGGHLFHYLDLVRALPEDQPVYGLRPPNVDDLRQVWTVEALAALYRTEIRKFQRDGPYQLCGMSFGGLIAIEVASQLIESGAEVALLALFDTANPAKAMREPLSGALLLWRRYAAHLHRKYVLSLVRGNYAEVTSMVRRSIESRIKSLAWRIVRGGSRVLNRPVPQRMHNMLATFSALNRSFKPRSFGGRLVLFRAKDRPGGLNGDQSLGWGDVASGGVEVLFVPGGHISMMRPPNVLHLAKQLDSRLICAQKAAE